MPVLVRSKPKPFSPREIPGIEYWFDAQAIRGLSGGSSVTTVLDRLRKIDVTESTNPPAYRTTGINGFPSVDFDGTNDELSGGTGDLNIGGETSLWIFSVVALDTVTAFRAVINKEDNLGPDLDRGFNLFVAQTSGIPGWIIPTSSTTRIRRDGRSNINNRGPLLLSARFTGSTNQDVFVNGMLDNGGIDGSIPASVGNDGGEFQIGRTAFGEFFDGDHGEHIVVVGPLTDVQRQRIESYLIDKWSLFGRTATFRSPDFNDHQGYSSSATKHFTSDTAAVRRRNDDATWSVDTENTSDLFTGTQDHVGDIHYVASVDKIYAAVNQFTSCADNSEPTITIFSNSTGLPRDDSVTVPGTVYAISGIVVVPEHGRVYATDFCDGTVIYKYTYTTLSTLAGLTADGTISLDTTVDNPQGITYKDGVFYVSSTNGTSGGVPQRLWKVSQTGKVTKLVESWLPGTAEGIDHNQDTLRWMIDDGDNEHVWYIEPPLRERRRNRIFFPTAGPGITVELSPLIAQASIPTAVASVGRSVAPAPLQAGASLSVSLASVGVGVQPAPLVAGASLANPLLSVGRVVKPSPLAAEASLPVHVVFSGGTASDVCGRVSVQPAVAGSVFVNPCD